MKYFFVIVFVFVIVVFVRFKFMNFNYDVVVGEFFIFRWDFVEGNVKILFYKGMVGNENSFKFVEVFISEYFLVIDWYL